MQRIYKITNQINGKIYIGKTVLPIEKRLKRHFYLLTAKEVDEFCELLQSKKKEIWKE